MIAHYFNVTAQTLELLAIVLQKSAYRRRFWSVFSIVPVLLLKIWEYLLILCCKWSTICRTSKAAFQKKHVVGTEEIKSLNVQCIKKYFCKYVFLVSNPIFLMYLLFHGETGAFFFNLCNVPIFHSISTMCLLHWFSRDKGLHCTVLSMTGTRNL